MKLGYIGLGNMGSALASRLHLTHPLHVHDLNAAAMERFAQKGAIPCANPAELAARCEVVFLCLPTSEHVKAAIFGTNGLAERLQRGALVIDQSSGDPAITRSMAAELAQRGIDLVDAPVSGGPDGAEAGTIAIMVGATREQLERVSPWLRAISPNLFYAGGNGAGHVMKLVNNMLSGAQRLLSLEALALATKNGIAPQVACDILTAGGGRNAYLETFVRQRLLTGKLKLGFSLGLMHKDLRLACQLGSECGVPLLFGSLAREMYQMGISEMGAGGNVQAVALMVDRMAGTRLVPAGHDLA